MHSAFLLLGSNMGDKSNLLQQARELLNGQAGTIVQQSSLYESEPWGFVSPDSFINQALKIETNLAPLQLLSVTQQIEKALGRKQKSTTENYSSRPIDIDILLYDKTTIHLPELIIPHVQLHERRFALLPLCEIAATIIHPSFQQSISELLVQCKDKGVVDLMKN